MLKKTCLFILTIIIIVTGAVFAVSAEHRNLDVYDNYYREYEMNDSFSEANIIYSDYTVAASINPAGDVDVYTFTVTKKSEFFIIVGTDTADLNFGIYNSSGDLLFTGDLQQGENAWLRTFTGTATPGTYYIAVLAADGRRASYDLYYYAEAVSSSTHTHSYTKKITKQPTCTKTGTATYTCSCGDSYTETIAKKGHSYSSYKSNNDATYTKDGTKTAKCTSCGISKTVTDKGSKKKLGITSKITVQQYNDSYMLSWKKVTDATGYRVFVKNGSNWKTLQTSSATSYEALGLVAGQEYTYAVKAYLVKDGTTIWAPKYQTVTFKATPSPTEVTSIVSGTDYVTLTWNKIEGATGYRVFVRVNNSWKTLKTTAATTYKITGLVPGEQYQFAVRTYAKIDGVTIWASKFNTYNTATKPVATTVRTASTAKGRATVAWTDVDGETGYQVYYSTKSNSGFKKIANYKADTVKIYKTGLESGKTYYFRVRSYIKTDSGYVYSSYSNVKAVKIK